MMYTVFVITFCYYKLTYYIHIYVVCTYNTDTNIPIKQSIKHCIKIHIKLLM